MDGAYAEIGDRFRKNCFVTKAITINGEVLIIHTVRLFSFPAALVKMSKAITNTSD